MSKKDLSLLDKLSLHIAIKTQQRFMVIPIPKLYVR
jgi:hypothetical protein